MLKIDFVGTNSNNDSSSIEISEIVYAKQEQGRCTTSQGRGNKHEVITKALSKSPVRLLGSWKSGVNNPPSTDKITGRTTTSHGNFLPFIRQSHSYRHNNVVRQARSQRRCQRL